MTNRGEFDKIVRAGLEPFAEIPMHYKLPIILDPQPEGGYTVTSPLLPELVTEGDTLEEVMENVRDALEVVLEIYRDENRDLPIGLASPAADPRVHAEMVISVP